MEILPLLTSYTTRSMAVLSYLHKPISEVHKHLVRYVNQYMTSLLRLVDMDEGVPEWFDLFAYTPDEVGSKQAVVRSGSRTNTRITIVPAYTGDGRKLTLVIPAKSKYEVRNCQDFAGVRVWLQQGKIFIDLNIMRS